MTGHVLEAFNVRFRLQVIPEPGVQRMRVFSCATDVGEFVTGQTATEFRFKGARMRAFIVLQVANQDRQQVGQQSAICSPML
jgi:hypothetical protein